MLFLRCHNIDCKSKRTMVLDVKNPKIPPGWIQVLAGEMGLSYEFCSWGCLSMFASYEAETEQHLASFDAEVG